MTSQPGRMTGPAEGTPGDLPVLESSRETDRATGTRFHATIGVLAAMGHDIRTPLNVMLGLAQLLRRTDLDDRQLDYVSTFDASARSLVGTFNDILEFLNLEAGLVTLDRVPVGVSDVLDRVRGAVAGTVASRGVTVRCRVEPGVPSVVIGDVKRLQRVLTDVIGTAAECASATEADLHVNAAPGDGQDVVLNFVVRCPDAVMPEADRTRLRAEFQPWDDAHASRFGRRGLGLAISQRLTLMMRGAISVEPDAHGGCAFVFSAAFGRADGRMASAAPGAPEFEASGLPPLPLHGWRVLLVEDDALSREAARATLEESGALVIEAADGGDAIRLARERVAELDVVLTDVHLAGVNGLDIAEAIRTDQATASLPIIALTASSLPSDRESCLEAGMNGFFTKPVDPGDLARALPGLTARRRQEAAPRVRAGERGRSWIEQLAAAHGADAALIAEAIRAGDAEKAAALAHALAGAAATIGASAVAAAAVNVERGIRSGNGASWTPRIAELASALARLPAAFVPQREALPTVNGIGHSPVDVAHLLLVLDRQLASHALGAGRTADLLTQALAPTGVDSGVRALTAAIRGLQFADARVLLAGLARRLGVSLDADLGA